MHHTIKKQLEKIEKQEKKYLQTKQEKGIQKKTKEVSAILEQKIPLKVREAIENAFYKGFFVLFEKGTSVIEKTYDKEKIVWEYQFQDYRFTEKGKRKQFKKLEKNANHGNYINLATTATEGAVLGLLGIGLPDIPLFLGILLKGIYETCLHYGFDYSDKREQIYILRLIRSAMAEEKIELDALVEKTAEDIAKGIAVPYDFQEEVKQTAQMFSNAMLVAKLIQGIPLVGVMGSGYNVMVYHKILKYCNRKYKKRYLKKFSPECIK